MSKYAQYEIVHAIIISKEAAAMFKNYNEVLENAKKVLEGYCDVCPECNGIRCKGKVPGCGAKGSGASFTVCREYLKSVKIKLSAVHEHFDADTGFEAFGKKFEAPIFIAPIGGMALNYGGIMTEKEYVQAVTKGAFDAGIAAWTGDGPNKEYFETALPMIQGLDGKIIPTVKPWNQAEAIGRIEAVRKSGAMAVAMDIDSAALVNLKLVGKAVYTKTEAELKELADAAQIPFIAKGVMTAEDAIECADAGCYGIVVSTHGGRIMEDNPAPAMMLPEIKKAVGNRIKIFVDGGIRSGADVFKCLALGADAVLVGRPYAIAAHGGKDEGVRLLTEKLVSELKETMLMADAKTLSDISIDKLVFLR